MNQIVKNFQHEKTMSSREIAEVVESRYDNVKRTMETLLEKGLIAFTQTEEKTLGRPGVVYHVNKRDSYVVVAQLSPEFTARLVDRWQELEQQLAQPFQIPQTMAEALRLAADQQEQIEQQQRDLDHAIATKAQISSSREASVMGKLSAASRKMKQLEQELGRNAIEATVTAVEKAVGHKYGKQGFRPLKKWCKENAIAPSKVPCPRYGEVVAWPAAAWLECYGIDLTEVFGEVSA